MLYCLFRGITSGEHIIKSKWATIYRRQIRVEKTNLKNWWVISVFLFFSAVVFVSEVFGNEIDPNMISYWKFDEGTGMIAYDWISKNHGNIYWASWTAGIVGGALSFNGTDEYLDCGDDISLDVGVPFTVEAWIYRRGLFTSIHRLIVGKCHPYHFCLHSNTGYLTIGIHPPPYTETNFVSTYIPPVNTWVHVAATLDVSGNLKIYANGDEKGSWSGVQPGESTTGPVGIGANSCDGISWNNYFDGLIDEVAIYDRALTTEEIEQHYQNGLSGSGYIEDVGKQPDIQIRTDDELAYNGDNIYNNLPSQSKSQTIGPSMSAVYYIKLENDESIAGRFMVDGTGSTEDWNVSYYNILEEKDVTSEVTGAGWTSPVIPINGYIELLLEVAPEPNIPDSSMLEELLMAACLIDPNLSDTVRTITTFSLTGYTPSDIYTTNEDFDRGTLIGVEHETVTDQLQLSLEPTTMPFIWVPNSNEGTVSKVDTVTGKELARYYTGPEGNGNPSRTTVDLFGNCWVGNRYTGTVVNIGLLENGEYMDRNYNGIIETSMDINGDGNITGDEILPWASDECVLYEVVLIPDSEGTYIPGQYQGPYASDYLNPGPRGIAVDAYNNIWAGCYGSKKYYYIQGHDGQILKTVDVSSLNHTPYGAVVDPNGILWSSGQNKDHVLWLDPADDSYSTIGLPHYVYGLGLDYSGHLFVAGWEDSKLSRIDIFTRTVDWTKAGVYQSRGVACTYDGDVWTADSGPGTVTRWSNDGTIKETISVGDTPAGVAVDAEGKVWVVNYGDEYIKRIDPNNNSIDLSKRIVGGLHYGYSDMTGIVASTATTKIGTWSVIHNTRVFGSSWGVISWDSYEPRGTSIKVKLRSSDNRQVWSLWEDATSYSALRNTPDGRYLEAKVTFQSTSEDTSPILYDLTVTPSPCCGDLEHPYPQSDTNKDCRVDLIDISLVAVEWLDCTAPECD